MARKKTVKPPRRRTWRRWLAAAMLAALLATAGWGALNADIVRLRRASVYIPDLPRSFEGVTVLYLSDIDLCGTNTPGKSATLVKRLQALNPDMLLLGGDYASPSLLELLNRTDAEQYARRLAERREAFFRQIAGFQAPMGCYALAAPEDGDPAAMAALFSECGFRDITGGAVAISKGGDRLWLAGFSGDRLASRILMEQRESGGDCVIALADSPAAFPLLLTLEAPGGGALIDMGLAGHTHAGQARLFGRTAVPLTSQERQYLYGWNRSAGIPLLTTAGLGCEAVNLRYGTQPEAWLITLTGGREAE